MVAVLDDVAACGVAGERASDDICALRGGFVLPESAVARDDLDGDGIADGKDKCPRVAEDADGFEDADGCPDVDDDADGIEDAKDECARRAEDLDGQRALVAPEPQVPERPLVPVLQSRAAHHLGADQPGAEAPALTPEGLHADAGHRREHDSGRDLDVPDAPGRLDVRGHERRS
mgnify:CR=1 FL=1